MSENSIFISESAITDAVSEAFTPIKLSKEQEREYKSVFFPGRKASASSPITSKDYYFIVEYLYDVQDRVQRTMFYLQRLIRQASDFDVMYGKYNLDEKNPYSDLLENIYSTTVDSSEFAVTLGEQPKKIKDSAISIFIECTKNGNNHYIENGENGDKIIKFVGYRMQRRSTTIMSYSVSPYGLPVSKDSILYRNADLNSYSTEFADTVRKTAEKIMSFLGIDTSLENVTKRKVIESSFDVDFGVIDKILLEANLLPVEYGEGFFGDMNPPPSSISTLRKYIRPLFVVEPNDSILKLKEDEILTTKRYMEDSNYPQPKPFNHDNVTDEARLLSPLIGMSFQLRIPGYIVNYITQQEENHSLMSLHMWLRSWTSGLIRRPGSRNSVKVSNIPKYILPISTLTKVREIRKENNYYTEEGKSDENGITVSSSGTLNYIPKSGEITSKSAIEYEKKVDEVLQTHYDNKIPVITQFKSLPSSYLSTNHELDLDNLSNIKKSLETQKGKPLSVDWDYGTALYVSGDGISVDSIDLNENNIPDILTIADYLGKTFSSLDKNEKRKTFVKSLKLMFRNTSFTRTEGFNPDDIDSAYVTSDRSFGNTPIVDAIAKLYSNMVVKKQAPSLEEIVKQAWLNLGYDKEENKGDLAFERAMYNGTMPGVASIDIETGKLESNPDIVASIKWWLGEALHDASGNLGTNLYSIGAVLLEKEIGKPPEHYDILNKSKTSVRYFNHAESSLADFSNVYRYLGGQIFYLVCSIIAETPVVDLPYNVYDDENYVKGLVFGYNLTFRKVSTEIMPAAKMFAHYVPNSESIFEEAEKLDLANKENPDIEADDILIPGIQDGTQMFPHQVKAHKYLRNRPKFAVLDVDPGGGKTITVLSDIMNVVREDPETRPLIIAPDNLVKNWTDDLVKIVGANWNVIPITNVIVGDRQDKWSFEDLDMLLSNAPKNTIVVTGINFLKSKTYNIVLGTTVRKTSASLEFLKRYKFNYIALDESHKAKNPASRVHKAIKELTSMSVVKYVRLATGTLINNTLTDIVGQASLYNSAIFRTKQEYIDENTTLNPESNAIMWYNDTPARARKKLSMYSSVITIKRKEWAWMLPSPIERFTAVVIHDEDLNIPGTELHQRLYDSVLNDMLTDVDKAIRNAKRRNEDDVDFSEEEGDDELLLQTDGVPLDLDIDESSEVDLLSLSSLVTPYIQRLEMILTDPMNDDLGARLFEEAGINNFVSRKVQTALNLVKDHFNVVSWNPQEIYKELDLVKHKGKQWLLRKQNISDFSRADMPNAGEPSEDSPYWKEEPEGKLLIFCRYTRSSEAVYESLPPEYKKQARLFTGTTKNKWKNLEDFKNDNDVKILVANEQAITEGHNLQVASRIIRLEVPWAPGDLEQSSARIFRPDPSASKDMREKGKPGELYRDVIFIDTVIVNYTLEVQKLGRLISKILNKAKFDETGNSRYDEFTSVSLETISMSMDSLRDVMSLENLTGVTVDEDGNEIINNSTNYLGMYRLLQNIRNEEFAEMRSKAEAKMIDLPKVPPLEGGRMLKTVPTLPNQQIADPDNVGLTPLMYFLNDKSNKDYKEDPTLLKGLPVKTSLGYGEIISVTVRYTKDEEGYKVVDKNKPILRVKVALKDDMMYDIINTPPTSVYVATDVPENKKDKFFSSKITDIPPEEQEDSEIIVDSSEDKSKVDKILTSENRAKRRRKNRRQNRPVNEGITKVPKIRPTTGVDTSLTPVEDNALDMEIAVINGYLALTTDVDDPDANKLKKLGFVRFGEYAYIESKTLQRFYKVLDFLEDKFDLTNDSVKRLTDIQDAFEEGRIVRARFNPDLAPLSSIRNFFVTRKRPVQDKRKQLRVYPVVYEDKLVLAIDILTSPAIRKYIGKAIPGAATKVKESSGRWSFFARTKAEARDKLKELVKSGFTIRNRSDVIEDLKRLKPRTRQIGK